MKEEALKKSELMLEEDAIRFDSFLKENDKKAHEAIKRAEHETKLKNEALQEIKHLNAKIQTVQNEMSKLKEQLDDCQKYKEFLDALTPVEYVEEQRRIKQERKQKRLEKKKQVLLKQWENDKAAILQEAASMTSIESTNNPANLSNNKKPEKSKKKADKSTKKEIQLPPMPKLDELEVTSRYVWEHQ